MTEQFTTYTIKSKADGFVWQFKYHLNGVLAECKMFDGILSDKQIGWLKQQFPYYQTDVEEWKIKLQQNFDISITPPDLTFNALWELYNYKLSKQDAIKAFNKLKEPEILLCFIDVPKYLQWLKRNPNVQQLNLATYISKRRYEDERPDSVKGKVYNTTLIDLAKSKQIK